MATKVLRSVRLPSDEAASLAAKSGRLLAACVGTGERSRVRLIDGDADVTVPVSAIQLRVEILNQMAPGQCRFARASPCEAHHPAGGGSPQRLATLSG